MSERSALLKLLEPGGLRAFFQPIVDLSGEPKIGSVEALVRGPVGTNMQSANVLFDYVRFKREESTVDRACIVAALSEARALDASVHINLNVHACTLGRDLAFIPFLETKAEENGIALSRLTVEIVEHAPPWDGANFLAALERLRERNVLIALDDVGLGQSNFKMIVDARPQYLKIDRYFIKGVSEDDSRRAVIESLALLAGRFDAQLVAEGVDNEADLEAAMDLGIQLMQGFLFYQPMTAAEFAERAPLPRVASVLPRDAASAS